MQVLSVSEVEEVSGGGVSVLQAVVSWGVSGLLNYAANAVSNYAANGGAPDYSRTTVDGSMY